MAKQLTAKKLIVSTPAFATMYLSGVIRTTLAVQPVPLKTLNYVQLHIDPYLEHPTLWPDVHNSLIAAIRDEMSPLVAPRYYVALERRAYLLKPDDIAFIGRPDLSVAVHAPRSYPAAGCLRRRRVGGGCCRGR